MRKSIAFYALIIFSCASCMKEDQALVLPPPGNLTRVVADIGADYSKQVFVNLANNTQVTRNLQDWDMAFETSADGFHVFLNSGKYMFACNTGNNDFALADTAGKSWKVDNDHLDDDSTAIGNWWNNGIAEGKVQVIDRGRIIYTGANANQRYKKIKFEQVTSTEYKFSYCDFNNNNPTTFTVAKDANYSLMYFSFDNGGKVVDIAPPKNDWDIVFTHYTHTYFDQPLNSPYRYYLVTGGLTNRWNNIAGMRLIKDSMPGYVSYDQITGLQASTFQMSSSADFIGYDWKVIDNTFNYLILTSRYYLLKDNNGYYYKMRFIDFYNSSGQKGAITFDFQRL